MAYSSSTPFRTKAIAIGPRGTECQRGADDRYWGEQGLPSVFKHAHLDKYVPQFAGRPAPEPARRVVFLDGFAGRGRSATDSPASAERILRIA